MPRLIVSSGQHEGRYVGPNISGMRTNPLLTSSPEVKLPGTPYSLWTQEQMATAYFEPKASEVQAELKVLGLETEQG